MSSACTFTSFGVHENVKLQPTTIDFDSLQLVLCLCVVSVYVHMYLSAYLNLQHTPPLALPTNGRKNQFSVHSVPLM